MKKFAYVLIGSEYDSPEHKAEFKTAKTHVMVRTAKDYEAAKELIQQLVAEGVKGVELCGGFGQERAREIMEMTDHKISLSYAVTEPEMKEINGKFFRGEL